MIPSFERETSPLSEDEKKLIPLLIRGFEHHIGKENAIAGSMIRKKLKEKNIIITGPRLRKMVNHIRLRDKSIILCSCGNGYYIASNTDEIKETIKSIQHRVNSQLEIIDALDNSLRLL